MNYNRTTLRATVISVRDAHLKAAKDQATREAAKYDKDLKRWRTEEKPVALVILADATRALKADRPVDTWALRNELKSPPSKPKPVDCCTTTVQTLDALVEVLDTIADENVSSSALSQAGFKDLSRLLRRPC